jgi:serine/threonine protein kinase
VELFGSYQLDSLIAVGGLGEVWHARATDGRFSDSRVAVKRLHTHLARNDEAREMFATEQMLAMSLPRHPGLMRGLEPGLVEGRPYLAVELAPGEDLRRMIMPDPKQPAAPRGAIDKTRALAIIRAACDAVQHLHTCGWVHGDVCPANLMVDGDRVTLVDFGVARKLGIAGAVRGTHAYMAPEQVKGEAWTAATDVFALGVVLWELVAGKRLFHRGPPWLTMAAVVEEAVPPLADDVLDAIVQAALIKDPKTRIPSAREFATRLSN